MKLVLITSLVLGALLLGRAGDALGQHWTELPHPKIYNKINPYFLNKNIGFVLEASGAVIPNLRRTTDAGISWTDIHFFNDQFIPISQLYFIDINRGYAAAFDGMYETEDTGNTWRKIYSGSYLTSVYAFGNHVFAFSGANWGTLLMTSNDGNTWDTIFSATPLDSLFNPMMPHVFGNKDSLVFAEGIDSSYTMFLRYSTNNGKDWFSNKMDVLDRTSRFDRTVTTGLFSFPHCRDILRTFALSPLNDPLNPDVYYITHSSDFGAHWDTLFHPVEIGAWIAGNNCVQYVSDAVNGGGREGGLWRSQDRGKNWVYVTGSNVGPGFQELDDQDFHNLSVVGGGAAVYAGDMSNSLWKTTDGGDGTLSATALASHISLDDTVNQGATVCDTSDLIIVYQNLSCNYSFLKNFSIDGLDSAQYSAKWRHHLACDDLPDSILIEIFPLNSAGGPFTLRTHFMNDEYETIDTSFTFTISPASSPVAIIYIKPSSLIAKAGDTIELSNYISCAQIPAQPGLSNVTLIYSLNTDLLTPFAFIPIKGVTADPVHITKTAATVALHFDPSFTFSGETELGKLRCVAYVTDTLETDIALMGATHSSGCLNTLADSNTAHFTLIGCGASTLSHFMKYSTAYDIKSIIPNPAGNSVQVILKNNGTTLRYQLFDVLGAIQRNGITTYNELQLDLSGLSEGNYYFRLSSENGIPITKNIVIRRYLLLRQRKELRHFY